MNDPGVFLHTCIKIIKSVFRRVQDGKHKPANSSEQNRFFLNILFKCDLTNRQKL